MRKLDYAILFATKAHDGQRRKSDDVDMIFHPFTVGMILQGAGMKEETVMAGILHDVVEDTKYSLEDIEKIFGKDVRDIVDEVTEYKSLSWKERKIEAIEKVRTASFEGKMVECADKINNLETLYDSLEKNGEKVWESFHKPLSDQNWYYTEMYKAVVDNLKDAESYELVKRYKEILDKIF